MFRSNNLVLAAIVFLGSTAVNAEVFRWVDAQGNVHFGDQPTNVDEPETVQLPKFQDPDPAYLERLEKQKRFSDARATDREKAAEEKKKQAEIDKEYAAACAKAKERLALLDGGGRLYIRGDGDDRHYLSDEDRVSEIEKTQKQIADYCKK